MTDTIDVLEAHPQEAAGLCLALLALLVLSAATGPGQKQRHQHQLAPRVGFHSQHQVPHVGGAMFKPNSWLCPEQGTGAGWRLSFFYLVMKWELKKWF